MTTCCPSLPWVKTRLPCGVTTDAIPDVYFTGLSELFSLQHAVPSCGCFKSETVCFFVFFCLHLWLESVVPCDPITMNTLTAQFSEPGVISVSLLFCFCFSSWVSSVEPNGGGLCQAALSAGAVPEGSVPPAVNQQTLRGRRPAEISQALQVFFFHLYVFQIFF